MENGPFKILIVCTGNLCRSPIAEHLLRAKTVTLGLADYWSISSVGTQAVEGTFMHGNAVLTLGERNIFPSPFWATKLLNARILSDADLILTAEVSHRKKVVALDPATVKRVFTIRQFAELTGLVEPLSEKGKERLGHALLASVVNARGRFQTIGSSLDLADPMGESIEQFRNCADLLTSSITAMVTPLVSYGP